MVSMILAKKSVFVSLFGVAQFFPLEIQGSKNDALIGKNDVFCHAQLQICLGSLEKAE